MPINIDKLPDNVLPTTFNPKFFDTKLTGRGGTSNTGLLSALNNPVNIAPDVVTNINHANLSKRTMHNGLTTITQIPLGLLPGHNWDYMFDYTVPDDVDILEIGTSIHGKQKLGITMQPQSIVLEETVTPPKNGVGQSSRDKKFTTCYEIMFFTANDLNDRTYTRVTNPTQFQLSSNRHMYSIIYSSNPLQELQSDIFQTLSQLYKINTQTILDYIQNYDLYTAVVKRSEEWQTTIDKLLAQYFKNIATHYVTDFMAMHFTRYLVKYIMNYNIPLDLYRHIYHAINTEFSDPDVAKHICKQNLNLLLSDTLNSLDQNKPQIQSFTPPTPAVTLPTSVQKLSTEQLNAVSCTDPLILVQAGAGTGKSTLILGRIDYLTACGVSPQDITVLSFTNAAADHITEKNPNVHSMTIARMIHEIYSTNFTGHELSSLDTIINSLDIYYPNIVPNKQRSIIDLFKRKLISMVKNEANHFTEMSNFIEDHYDEVINILNTIRQTSLELEIIICYLQIDNFQEPASVASKFLIIDEVQDNSIFEFVYMLKYINKHKESLFIVGDCSQTLYEFRASNPRALNILEGSGTFRTFQLNVNYRSNQEILEFANVLLENIEANQYAHIRLSANSMAVPTEQTFLDQVQFNYHRLNKLNDFSDALPSIFAKEIRPYLNKCLKRNEQVAFLAYTRNDIAKIQSILEAQYPNCKTVSLVPQKMYNSTIMSAYIKKYWDDVKFFPMNTIVNTLLQEVMQKLQYLTNRDKQIGPSVHTMLLKWRQEQGPIIQSWIQQVTNNQLSHDACLDLIRENMLQYEIRHNSIKQALLSSQNQKNKQSENVKDANFLISTIHSAKGLEFDNVVVFFRNENNMDEEKKRMYYVALTRAMKSEYILAYDVAASPQIEANYITVLEKLHNTHPSPNSPLDYIKRKRDGTKRIKI